LQFITDYLSKEISDCNVANLLLCNDNGRLSSVITGAVARNDVSLHVVWLLFSELQFLVYRVRYLVWEH